MAMVDGIFEDCIVDVVKVALWRGGGCVALEDEG
jgi:hypothetical protein